VAGGFGFPNGAVLTVFFVWGGVFETGFGLVGRAFGRCLEGWGTLLGGKVGGMEGKWAGGR